MAVLIVIGSGLLALGLGAWRGTCDTRPWMVLTPESLSLRRHSLLRPDPVTCDWAALCEIRIVRLGLGRDQMFVVTRTPEGRHRTFGFATRLMDTSWDDLREEFGRHLAAQGLRLAVPYGFTHVWRVEPV